MGGLEQLQRRVFDKLTYNAQKAIEKTIFYAAPNGNGVNDGIIAANPFLTQGNGLYSAPQHGIYDHGLVGTQTWDTNLGTCAYAEYVADANFGEVLSPVGGAATVAAAVSPNYKNVGNLSEADFLDLTDQMCCNPNRTVYVTNKRGSSKIKLLPCFSCHAAGSLGSAAYGGRLWESPWGTPVYISDCLYNVDETTGAPTTATGATTLCPFIALDVDAVKRGFSCDGTRLWSRRVEGKAGGYEFGMNFIFQLGIQDGQSCDERSIAVMAGK